MLRDFKADLHVHTCLSPCGDLGMGPRTIVEQAARRGLDMIGITDHNSSENAPAVVRAARGTPLAVLPGMEVTSKEEVHILALFDRVERAFRMQEIVYERLPGENDEKIFGLQVVVNEDHYVMGFNRRFLAGAAELSVDEIVEAIHQLSGLAIAAHADREAFGIAGQLGLIPEQLDLDALELSPRTTVEEARRRFPRSCGRGFVRSSDAHFADHIGSAMTWFVMDAATLEELRMALSGREGRRVAGWRSDATGEWEPAPD